MENLIMTLMVADQETEEYSKEYDNNPHKKYIDMAFEHFVEKELKSNRKTANENESILNGANASMEMLGFVRGFKCAMKLREECVKL